MPIQFFLGFIGCLLACTIALAIVVKNLAEGIAVSGKKPFLYGSGLALLSSVAAYFASYISENQFVVFWVFGGIFFLFGIVHMLLIHKRFFYEHKHNSNRVLVAEILFGLSFILVAIVIYSSLQFFFKDRNFFLYQIVVSSLLFLVPLLVFHSFQAAYDIPAAKFPTWQYPLHKRLELLDFDGGDRVLIIGFEVAKNAVDSRKDYFRVRAPETWQLSTLFYHFINEYNDPANKTTIEYIDREDEPFEWWFYKKQKWYQPRKILNPEFSIRESGIKENTVIVCERVLNTPQVLNKYNSKYYER